MIARIGTRIARLALLGAVVAGVAASAAAETPAATGGAATAAPTAAPTTDAKAAAAARKAECERYVTVLSGKKQDRAMLSNPAVQELAGRARALVTCGALAADSPELCQTLDPKGRASAVAEPKDKAFNEYNKSCVRMQHIFHELKAYPKGRSFLLPFTREECASMQNDAPSCVAFVDALRSGDATQCAKTGLFESTCNAMIKLDGALCKPASGLPDDLPSACREIIAGRGFLAKGLEPVAKDGPPTGNESVGRELGDAAQLREFAKAALGKPDACKTYAQAALDACVASGAEAAASDTPAASTPVAATPAP